MEGCIGGPVHQDARREFQEEDMALKAFALALLAVPLLAGPGRAAEDSAGNAEKGKTVFNRACAVCHSPEKGKAKIGPSLFGVVGRQAGTVEGYSYSPAMKSFNQKWTPEELDKYLANPQKVVPGTKMAYAGLKSEEQRQDVIAYLETLK